MKNTHTADAPDSQYSGIGYCTPCTSSISGFCAPGTASAGSIWCVGTASTASARSTEILLICAVYSEYEVRFDGLCTTVVSIISSPLFSRKLSQMLPRVGVGANYARWGQLEDLKSTGSISEIYTASTRRISRFCAANTACISGFDPAGAVLGVLYCSYSQYTQCLSLQYCSYSECSQCLGRQCYTRIINVLDLYSECTRSMKYTGSICEGFFIVASPPVRGTAFACAETRPDAWLYGYPVRVCLC